MSEQKVKCVVWDLDHTLWDGILTEETVHGLRDDVTQIIQSLDKRGILQSISSKNNYQQAKEKLEEFGLWEYFIYPQINWGAKSESVKKIAQLINIGIDTLAFVDDQPFELEEVSYSCPEVMCIPASEIPGLLDLERMKPRYITADSQKRRRMYQSDIIRNEVEDCYTGTKEEFLNTLHMVLTISLATEADLQRAEELTIRTHQLNSTGYIYSYNELKNFIEDTAHEVLVAQLDDKYGEYGKIGLVLIEKHKSLWDLKLLLMSCRVMSKGVGNILLNYIVNRARAAGVALQAQFVPTDRNRMMFITYKLNGFQELARETSYMRLAADTSYERKIPSYLKIVFGGMH